MDYTILRLYVNRRWVQDNHKWLKESGISDAVTNGSSSLPSLDPFQTIAPLLQLDGEPSETIYPSNVSQNFVNVREDDDDDSDWGDNNADFEINAFDFIIDDK